MQNIQFIFFFPKFSKIVSLIFFFSVFLTISNCGKYNPVSSRDTPTNAIERAKKNIEEGRGISVQGLFKNKGQTNFEFSSSNPMWRASLEVLDFLPFTVVDYSGGVLITDWYSDDINADSSLKISLRFLSNEVRSDSLKIIVHQKKCLASGNCSTKILNSKIQDELLTSIIRRAAVLQRDSNNKKK